MSSQETCAENTGNFLRLPGGQNARGSVRTAESETSRGIVPSEEPTLCGCPVATDPSAHAAGDGDVEGGGDRGAEAVRRRRPQRSPRRAGLLPPRCAAAAGARPGVRLRQARPASASPAPAHLPSSLPSVLRVTDRRGARHVEMASGAAPDSHALQRLRVPDWCVWITYRTEPGGVPAARPECRSLEHVLHRIGGVPLARALRAGASAALRGRAGTAQGPGGGGGRESHAGGRRARRPRLALRWRVLPPLSRTGPSCGRPLLPLLLQVGRSRGCGNGSVAFIRHSRFLEELNVSY